MIVRVAVGHFVDGMYGLLGGLAMYLFRAINQAEVFSAFKFFGTLIVAAIVGFWAGDFITPGVTGRDALISMCGALSFYFIKTIMDRGQQLLRGIFKI